MTNIPMSFDEAQPKTACLPDRLARNMELDARLGALLGWTNVTRKESRLHAGPPPEWFESFPGWPRNGGFFMPQWTLQDDDAMRLLVRFNFYALQEAGSVVVRSADGKAWGSEPLSPAGPKYEAYRFAVVKAVISFLEAGHPVAPD
jgi:hypothetical protein